MDSSATLSTSRILPFSPAAVFGAFSSAERLASWWGPQGFRNSFETFEFKPGWRWKFVMHGPDGTNYPNECVFTVLEPGAKVVIDHVCAPLFVLTVVLRAVDGGTRIEWHQAFEDSKTAEAVAHIVRPANEQNLDRLTRTLEQAAAPG